MLHILRLVFILFTLTEAIPDRCEIPDSCKDSDENCPIRQNYPSEDQNGVITGSLENIAQIWAGYNPKDYNL